MTDVLASRSASPPATSEAAIHACAEECQRIVDKSISGFISGPAFIERLKGAGATPDESQDYIEQYSQCRRDQDTAGMNTGGPFDQPDLNAPNPVDTATSIAWALLCAKVNHFQSAPPHAAATSKGSLSDELASLLGLSSSKSTIPASVLTKAPHLSKLSDLTATNPHLEKTQELLSVYSPQASQDIHQSCADCQGVGLESENARISKGEQMGLSFNF